LFLKNNRFLIETDFGFKNFEGISLSNHNEYIEIYLENFNKPIICSDKHKFYKKINNELVCFETNQLVEGDMIYSKNKLIKIEKIIKIKNKRTLFDIIDVDTPDHSFLINNNKHKIKTHNCQFLTFEKTLIDTDILDFYQIEQVLFEENGFEFFYENFHHPDSLIIITIDPSGSGEDYSVIQLWEISPKIVYQLGTFADKNADASIIFEKVLWLQHYIRNKFNYEPSNTLLLFERNGIGEGLAQLLTQTEKSMEELEIPIFYDKKGPGIHITPTIKNKLALQFKNLVEYQKLKINDKQFIDELYGFIRKSNGTYSAKSGYHDDRVTCSFLAVYYLMNVFADYAQGEFSVDNLLINDKNSKIQIVQEEMEDPIEKFRKKQEEERKKKEQESLKLEEERKKKEREALAKEAMKGASIVEEEKNDDDIDYDEYDILPTIV
jgi:hypothetical protein